MKKNLTSIPQKKRDQLNRAVKHIRLHCSKTEMIILFGSYARGSWTNDSYTVGHITYEYRSDFDLLVVVRDEQSERDTARWSAAETAISQDKEITTPVEVIPEAIDHLNKQLEKGRYFYRDIQKEGIILYDTGRFRLARPKELTAKERRQLAEEDFTTWTNKARIAFEQYEFNLARGDKDQEYLNEAAYQLHQTAERLLTAACLVFANYRPKTHDLANLIVFVSRYEPSFGDVFSEKLPQEQRRFKLLRRAYVDARFEPRTYNIERPDLLSLEQRVRHLRDLTTRASTEKIDGFS